MPRGDRIPASFKAAWEQCKADKVRAVADAKHAKAAEKAAKQQQIALKKQVAAAKKADKEARRRVAGPGEAGFARYLKETYEPKSVSPPKKRVTRAMTRASVL